jgi:hypothetical protein
MKGRLQVVIFVKHYRAPAQPLNPLIKTSQLIHIEPSHSTLAQVFLEAPEGARKLALPYG